MYLVRVSAVTGSCFHGFPFPTLSSPHILRVHLVRVLVATVVPVFLHATVLVHFSELLTALLLPILFILVLDTSLRINLTTTTAPARVPSVRMTSEFNLPSSETRSVQVSVRREAAGGITCLGGVPPWTLSWTLSCFPIPFYYFSYSFYWAPFALESWSSSLI